MLKFRTYLAAALLFLAGTELAQAQDARDADLRCMAVMAKINQLQDPKHQLESLIGGYYFLGRLQAMAPEMQLGSSTAQAYGQMSPAEFISETQRCEQEMRTNGHAMVEIGNAMPKATRKTPRRPKPSPTANDAVGSRQVFSALSQSAWPRYQAKVAANPAAKF